MSRPIRRLMLVSDGRSFGGAERYTLDMALAARRRGLEAHILWLPASGTARSVFECARQAGVAVTVNRGAVCWSGLVRGFRRSVARIRPDAVIINAAGRPRWWLTSWLAWGAGLPAAWVHHMVEQTDPRRLPPRRLGGRLEGPRWWRVPQALRHRLAAAAATAVVTSTDEDRDRVARWHSLNRSAICVIPPGVDCEKFRFDPAARTWVRKAWGISSGAAAPLVIGTAGRLVRGKGIEAIIEATARLRARGGAVLAVIAGDGPDKEAFVELARRRGVGDAVRFAGFVREMPAFHSALDVFALCSETESFGLALTEAMACERAV
ncbi:MAG: glycosyltransferase, partial [Phycisphaerae bacterium]